MGMNYYAVVNGPSCKDAIHIGKSSYGWLFNFQTQNCPYDDPPVVWNTYEQVREWLYKHTVEKKDFVIMDEENNIISWEEFFKMVEEKQNDPNNLANEDNFTYSRNVDGYRFSDGEFS